MPPPTPLHFPLRSPSFPTGFPLQALAEAEAAIETSRLQEGDRFELYARGLLAIVNASDQLDEMEERLKAYDTPTWTQMTVGKFAELLWHYIVWQMVGGGFLSRWLCDLGLNPYWPAMSFALSTIVWLAALAGMLKRWWMAFPILPALAAWQWNHNKDIVKAMGDDAAALKKLLDALNSDAAVLPTQLQQLLPTHHIRGGAVLEQLNSTHDAAKATHHALGQSSRDQEASKLAVAEAKAALVATSSVVSDAVANVSPFELSVWRWEESSDAVKAYGVFFGVLALGLIPALQANKYADLPYFLSLAAMTIYIGAHRGLNSRQRQQISIKEGLLAPVAASVSLFSLYLVLKFLPDLNLQTLLNAYFWLLGSISLVGAFGPTLRTLGKGLKQPVWHFEVPEWAQAEDEQGKVVTKSDIVPTDVLSVAAALTIATLDATANHGNFTLNNMIACLIAADILQLVGLKSFRVAGVLLFGLLAYDVFWVFGSPSVVGENVMLQVATSDVVTGPIRLLFPRIPGSIGEASTFPFSLLGLGDIAIPGLLACLALRYDASRCVDLRSRGAAVASALQDALGSIDKGATRAEMGDVAVSAAESAYNRIADIEDEQKMRTQGLSTSGSTATVYTASDAVLYQRTYFTPVLCAYVAGLVVAFGANAVTGMGQPALLYLCPLTLGSVAVLAATRGDLQRIWAFTDTTTEAAKKEGAEQQQQQQQQQQQDGK
ncbi:hypothetical protein D9Q98_010571 [Chlorella vulgaris]|uniref:Uncharacterized protein n=1 Tax=Chlorella vulgaris TaxID=3077 RepID=A0A9D4TQG4_CHLVU|nr:hypothetical protein D9Q98_010571 [Chlorella vulgaris]